MFSFNSRKKTVQLQRYLRRIVDLTTPNSAGSLEVVRLENRYNRAIPTLLCPWVDRRADLQRSAIVLTKDIADGGVGLIISHPFPIQEVVVGFWLDSGETQGPWFFHGNIQRSLPMGGGFWLLGVELLEFMNERWDAEVQPLMSLARKLLPPAPASCDEEQLMGAGADV